MFISVFSNVLLLALSQFCSPSLFYLLSYVNADMKIKFEFDKVLKILYSEVSFLGLTFLKICL